MDWLKYIPLIIAYATPIKRIIDVASSNLDIVQKITTAMPSITELVGTIGRQLFPKVPRELEVAAGAMAAFDPDVTKWIQGALNVLLEPSPALDVDGIYGSLTAGAVEKFQTQHRLVIDGWAGTITQSLIASLLVQKPVIA